ncbi:MAG: Eco57I restriction-modification methylase domain-containing protein [Actinomycetota bacterium]
MTATPIARHHTDWLSLVEVSGPFLTLPVLKRVWPQGLEPVDADLVGDLRRAYEEWQQDDDLHGQWVRWITTTLLGFEDETLREGPAIPEALAHAVDDGETIRPDLIGCDPSSDGQVIARLLVSIWSHDVQLDERLRDRRWSATPLDRMTDLLRATDVRLGLVTNGERWTLVHVPHGGPATYANWEAGLWLEERATLDAFATLLSARRFFSVSSSDTLEALFDESANAEQEVTDQLGKQVRQAVELLVDAFGRADREHRGELLPGIEPEQIYLAAVTVMMRLVFLLSAEERGLFLLGDPVYDASYAVSTLRGQLQEEADRFGEEPLEKRSAAWHRLLAAFRMVHAGVQHENLRLPAYGGSLFDPDRFSFLEGRQEGEQWHQDPGRPVPVDDRTVLHILDALLVLRFRLGGGVVEARRLSFRALDVEQIGHVYEGLLDHTAVHVSDPALGLDGKLEPEVALAEFEHQAKGERARFTAWLSELTGRTIKAIEKALDAPLDGPGRARLLVACDMDQILADRIARFHALIRDDLRGLPQIYVAGSVYVTKGSERRSSGTYYTPRSLAEEMVHYALEPLVYSPGPAEGAEPKDWRRKPPGELLELKICDMAMGSGAFLVASTRYLADQLVKAWAAAGPRPINLLGEATSVPEEAIPSDPDDQVILARRLVADRCIYGVDRNPMAVDMAKLSMWLITLAKDRPFSFLDHALKCGDSLLGVQALQQIEQLHMNAERGQRLHLTLEEHWRGWQTALKEAIERRRELESFTVLTIRDAEQKERLFREAEEALADLKVAGDIVVGAAISTAQDSDETLDSKLMAVAEDVAVALDRTDRDVDRRVRLENLRADALYWLNVGKAQLLPDRRPFHWPLEFPEVFLDQGGFDAIVGNPPFQGGQKITGALGIDYRDYLVEYVANGQRGSADLVAYFVLRAVSLLRQLGVVGMLATNTLAQGDTREVGLDQLVGDEVTILRAWKSRPWPGDANLEIGQVWLRRGQWQGLAVLDGREVSRIGPALVPTSRVEGHPHRLAVNAGQSFIGSYVLGMGFVLDGEEAKRLIRADSRNRDVLFPFLNGDDLNSRPDQSPSRWVINFFDWPLETAMKYPDCYRIVEERVKPERQHLRGRNPTGTQRAEAWWRYGRDARYLYEAIHGLDRVIAIALTSKTVMPMFVPTGVVYSHALGLFAYDDDAHFGILSSAFHWWWALSHASTLETRIRYTPTDCFETFPQSEPTDEIARAAKVLDEHRRSMMLERSEGVTKIYNRVHNAGEKAADVLHLRSLHVELDHAVAAAYAWGDLALDHDHHGTPQGLRYTVGPITRAEILDRLLELNHERYHQELAAGLHIKKKAGGSRRSKNQPNHPTFEGTS